MDNVVKAIQAVGSCLEIGDTAERLRRLSAFQEDSGLPWWVALKKDTTSYGSIKDLVDGAVNAEKAACDPTAGGNALATLRDQTAALKAAFADSTILDSAKALPDQSEQARVQAEVDQLTSSLQRWAESLLRDLAELELFKAVASKSASAVEGALKRAAPHARAPAIDSAKASLDVLNNADALTRDRNALQKELSAAAKNGIVAAKKSGGGGSGGGALAVDTAAQGLADQGPAGNQGGGGSADLNLKKEMSDLKRRLAMSEANLEAVQYDLREANKKHKLAQREITRLKSKAAIDGKAAGGGEGGAAQLDDDDDAAAAAAADAELADTAADSDAANDAAKSAVNRGALSPENANAIEQCLDALRQLQQWTDEDSVATYNWEDAREVYACSHRIINYLVLLVRLMEMPTGMRAQLILADSRGAGHLSQSLSPGGGGGGGGGSFNRKNDLLRSSASAAAFTSPGGDRLEAKRHTGGSLSQRSPAGAQSPGAGALSAVVSAPPYNQHLSPLQQNILSLNSLGPAGANSSSNNVLNGGNRVATKLRYKPVVKDYSSREEKANEKARERQRLAFVKRIARSGQAAELSEGDAEFARRNGLLPPVVPSHDAGRRPRAKRSSPRTSFAGQSQRKAQPKTVNRTAVVLAAYHSPDERMLQIQEGEQLLIEAEMPSKWLKAKNQHGDVGLVPPDFVSIV